MKKRHFGQKVYNAPRLDPGVKSYCVTAHMVRAKVNICQGAEGRRSVRGQLRHREPHKPYERI